MGTWTLSVLQKTVTAWLSLEVLNDLLVPSREEGYIIPIYYIPTPIVPTKNKKDEESTILLPEFLLQAGSTLEKLPAGAGCSRLETLDLTCEVISASRRRCDSLGKGCSGACNYDRM